MKTMNYLLVLSTIVFAFCSEYSESKIELSDFSKECLKGYLDKNKTLIENDFLMVDSTKNVKYTISNGVLSCKIYTKYDCIDEDALTGAYSISNDTITLFMKAKSNGISSTCICPSYLTYKFKGIDIRKKYILRFTGIKYIPI